MLEATDNAYPKFAVLENVPGMYSSAGGDDFLEVLNEIIHIKDESARRTPACQFLSLKRDGRPQAKSWETVFV
jgi:site-specific DNA-cytosine methylase